MTVHILADDLTGALECATAFAAQTPVAVHLQAPMAATDAVQVVATDTRNGSPEQWMATLAACLPWFQGGDIAFKKVDSLLRGNTLGEVAWLARQGRFDAVVFAPAFPGQGRLTLGGKQCLVSPAEAQPVLANSNAVDVVAGLQAQGLLAFHVNHDDQPVPHPGKVMVLNATDDSALHYLASLHKHPDASGWLWCGTGALATQLAAQRPAGGQPVPPAGDQAADRHRQGPLVVATSSCHPVLREQWSELQQSENHLYHGRPSWVLSDLMDVQPLSPRAAQRALARKALQVVQGHPHPAALVVVGGDTLLALCKASGATGLLAMPPVRPGWGHAQLQGGVWDGIRCYSRSGAFGDRHDVRDLLLQINPVPH